MEIIECNFTRPQSIADVAAEYRSYISGVRDGTQPGLWIDDSPCDSPIEDIFYREVQKWMASDVALSRQAECPTRFAVFRLDFLAVVGSRRIGIECDGKDFHEPARDFHRDTAILDAGHADVIYRLTGRDLCYHLHDALDLLRDRERGLFSARGHVNIESLASRPFEDDFVRSKVGSATRFYSEPPDSEEGWRPFPPTVLRWVSSGGARPTVADFKAAKEGLKC